MLNITSIPGVVAFKDVRNSLKKHATLRYATRSLAQIKHIVLHHSLTLTGSAEAYARYHVETNGWPGIAYHICIEQDGTVKWCNNIEAKSYHSGNSNGSSIGIVLTGDFTKQEPTAAQYKSLYATIAFLRGKLNVSVDRVRGHQEMPGYSWKQCPALDMDAMRGEIQAGTNRAVKADFQNDSKIVIDKVAGSTEKAPSTQKPAATLPDYITIQQGDTLWGIANNRAGLTVADLLALNPGVTAENLKPGMQIKLKKSSTAQKPAATTSKIELPSGVFKKGSKGRNVLQLQRALISLYFYPNKKAKDKGADGIFGADTQDALKRFQSIYCKKADGIYGPDTKTAFEKLLK